MFIRIKRRRLKSSDDEKPDFSLRVYLVENRRVKGSPRQRVIAYLGSIRMTEIAIENRRKNFLVLASKRISDVTSDYREVMRLKQSMIKQLVAERYSNWQTSDWTEQWFRNSSAEHLNRKMVEAKTEFATALDILKKTMWKIRITRAEQEMLKRRS